MCDLSPSHSMCGLSHSHYMSLHHGRIKRKGGGSTGRVQVIRRTKSAQVSAAPKQRSGRERGREGEREGGREGGREVKTEVGNMWRQN